jgi:hypothetical protein
MKVHTDAFRIDTDSPAWLRPMALLEFEQQREDSEIWSNWSRCLLLDRQRQAACCRFVLGR